MSLRRSQNTLETNRRRRKEEGKAGGIQAEEEENEEEGDSVVVGGGGRESFARTVQREREQGEAVNDLDPVGRSGPGTGQQNTSDDYHLAIERSTAEGNDHEPCPPQRPLPSKPVNSSSHNPLTNILQTATPLPSNSRSITLAQVTPDIAPSRSTGNINLNPQPQRIPDPNPNPNPKTLQPETPLAPLPPLALKPSLAVLPQPRLRLGLQHPHPGPGTGSGVMGLRKQVLNLKRGVSVGVGQLPDSVADTPPHPGLKSRLAESVADTPAPAVQLACPEFVGDTPVGNLVSQEEAEETPSRSFSQSQSQSQAQYDLTFNPDAEENMHSTPLVIPGRISPPLPFSIPSFFGGNTAGGLRSERTFDHLAATGTVGSARSGVMGLGLGDGDSGDSDIFGDLTTIPTQIQGRSRTQAGSQAHTRGEVGPGLCRSTDRREDVPVVAVAAGVEMPFSVSSVEESRRSEMAVKVGVERVEIEEEAQDRGKGREEKGSGGGMEGDEVEGEGTAEKESTGKQNFSFACEGKIS